MRKSYKSIYCSKLILDNKVNLNLVYKWQTYAAIFLLIFLPKCSAVVKSEKIVVAVVAGRTANNKMEGLGKLEGLLDISVDDKVATDERDDAVVESWLSIKSDNLVLNAGHRNKFFHDWLHAKELLAFIAEHWHLCVKSLECWPVCVESLVVVFNKLLADLFERHLELKNYTINSLIFK